MKSFTTTCALLGLSRAQTALVTPFLLGVSSSHMGYGLLLHFLLCNSPASASAPLQASSVV